LKKKHPEHVNLERWLVSYADFITLLFAFFVVMYAIANQDKAKIKQITESIEKSFTGASGKLDLGTGTKVNVMSQLMSPAGHVIDYPMGHNNAIPLNTPELAKIAERIEESLNYQLQTTDLKDTLQLVYDERGLVLRFSANKLFKPGEENVDPAYLGFLDKIGRIIADTDRLIRVEGHTDNTAQSSNSRFPTNWELSTARAAWIVRYFMAKFRIPPNRLAAAGYADGYPLADNKTEEGRARNRRVEIVVTNIRQMGPAQQEPRKEIPAGKAAEAARKEILGNPKKDH
jgi:chemotaxis protein MotB